jgi:hypothetical protein
MKNIKTFEGFLNETLSGDVVYIHQNTLWCSWAISSGVTAQIPGNPDEWRGFFKNFDGGLSSGTYHSIVDDIAKWALKQKSEVKKNGATLHKIPAYWQKGSNSDLSIYGGGIKPDYYLYMLVQRLTNNRVIISFFKTKKEAVAFLN